MPTTTSYVSARPNFFTLTAQSSTTASSVVDQVHIQNAQADDVQAAELENEARLAKEGVGSDPGVQREAALNAAAAELRREAAAEYEAAGDVQDAQNDQKLANDDDNSFTRTTGRFIG
jgi:hypothetical protein